MHLARGHIRAESIGTTASHKPGCATGLLASETCHANLHERKSPFIVEDYAQPRRTDEDVMAQH